MDTQKPKTLQKVEDLLMKEPEYKAAAKEKIGPCILVGKPKDKAGKVVVDMTGGTSGSQDIFGRLSQLGVGVWQTAISVVMAISYSCRGRNGITSPFPSVSVLSQRSSSASEWA